MITSNQVVSAVEDAVDVDLSQDEIRDSVQAAVDPDSNLVTIEVTADDADLAAALANALARQTKKVVTEDARSRACARRSTASRRRSRTSRTYRRTGP